MLRLVRGGGWIESRTQARRVVRPARSQRRRQEQHAARADRPAAAVCRARHGLRPAMSSATGPRSSRSSATFPIARITSRSSAAGATSTSSPSLYNVAKSPHRRMPGPRRAERSGRPAGPRLFAGHAPEAAARACPAPPAATALPRRADRQSRYSFEQRLCGASCASLVAEAARCC